jgi:hypothetical protein
MRVEEYRQDYASFNEDLLREYYLHHSGQKPDLELGPIYARHSDLFTVESIDRLRQDLRETSNHFETARAGLRHLLSFAINNFLEARVENLTEEISAREASAAVDWAGRLMTFQETAIAIANESNRALRNELFQARISMIRASNDLRAERLSKLHEAARNIGPVEPRVEIPAATRQASELIFGDQQPEAAYGAAPAHAAIQDYASLYEELTGLDFLELESRCRTLLSRTEPTYVARLSEALKAHLGIKLDDATRSDAVYFLHHSPQEFRFPATGLLGVYRATMEGLGIRTDTQTNIFIDDEPRPRKNPRAFCAPIRIPTEIRLVIRPFGGQSDYLALLHEAGHAQHYAWTSDSLLPEFKYTGDPALTETYAFLFNHLPGDPAWLGSMLGFSDNSDFVRATMLAKLVTVRRYAAKFIYERELHSNGDLKSACDLYADLQTDATKFKTGEVEFLFDLDDGFYSAGYLRAWAFEVGLREHMKSRFGKNWWTSRKAGSFLKEIWETGERHTADEMASLIGIGPITFDWLIDEFATTLD